MLYVVANFDVQTPGMKIIASTYIFLFWRVWVKKNKKKKKLGIVEAGRGNQLLEHRHLVSNV